jgi:peptide-methionine (S)-S-oxide reductase
LTGHNEVVLVIFNPAKITYEALLKTFWEAHDPTQGMRQGNDVGTQYRSGIYVANEAQREAALASRESFQASLRKAGFGRITSEIADASPFYYAEDHHQQYLAKNPAAVRARGHGSSIRLIRWHRLNNDNQFNELM